jgi:heavy metal translocating P-type ATPase
VSAGQVEFWLETLDVVEHVRVNRPARSVVVEFRPGNAARTAVLERVRRFRIDPQGAPTDEGEDGGVVGLFTALAALALLPVLPAVGKRALTLLAIGPTLARGADAFIHGGVRTEVLDALAVGLAASRGEYYTAALTGSMLALGEYLEERTARQSDRMLRRLLSPKPAPAWVEREGTLIQVPGEDVREGEIVVVGVGETVPVDGRVIDGAALVNQAAITGEDVPVRREPRQRAISGSVVVDGRIKLEATRVGDDTTTARVARFIQESLSQRSTTQRLTDELADRRVYLTLGTGAAVYALTRDIRRLQSVFLVDYSCALKLGTPVAFKSGMVRAAGGGVLMKGGEAIESMAAIDTLVFDKTGTLTHSELAVTDVVSLDGQHDEAGLLALVASVEEHATHPIASAVVEEARARELDHISHGEVSYLVAHGMSADVDDGRLYVGSRHYLEEHLALDFSRHDRAIDRLQAQGKILLYVGDENGPVGLVALRDRVRGDAREALVRLRRLGIRRMVMITGDRRAKAEALGSRLGMDEIHADMPPEEKAAVVERLQREGARVGFVGDGVNDGPALAASEVGIAMPRGADIARATADIVLMDDRLSAVADARSVAVDTMRLIRTNFNLAVGINTVILGAAAIGRLSPVASAVLHNGSTLGILANALTGGRLTGAGKKKAEPGIRDSANGE